MQLETKTNKQLLTELQTLKERVKELETAELDYERVKKGLRKAETLLRKVFESGSGLLSVYDKDLRIIYSTWLGSHEYVPEEISLQKPPCHNAHCPGQDGPCDHCHILEVFKTGGTVIAEKTNTSIGHLEAHAYPLFDDSGSVALVVEKAINITERKRVLEEMRKSNERLDLLAETASQLLKSNSPQKVVDSLCHKVLAFLDCQAFFNYLVDDEKQRLHLNAFGGIPEKDAGKMEWLDYGEGLSGCSARDGRRLVVEDVQEKSDQYAALVRPFGIKAYACHPLISKGQVLGTLSFCARNRNQFTEDELSLMQAVADHVAIAIDRRQTEEKLRRAYGALEMRVTERTVELADMVNKLQKGIKERERTELALRQSKDRYALAVDSANDGIWDIDLLKGEVFYSSRWKRMLGYEDNEITSSLEEWESRIHPDDHKVAMETRKAYLEGLIPTYEVKYRLRHKNDSYCWIRDHGACLRDSRGKPYRMAGSHTDITEKKRIKGALLESEKRYRELFEESKDTAFIVDARGKLVDINPAGSELLGYTKEELLVLDLVHDLHITQQARSQFRKNLVPEGYVKDAELELRRKDGRTVVVHVSASLMYDAEGRLSGYRGIAHDVTERKRLEQQLLQAQKMESIGLLAGGVAHEFNNLLTAIIGCADELQESIDGRDELSQSNIKTIQSAAKEAAEFTRNLLSFSRKQLMTLQPVAVKDVITDTLKLLHKMLSKNIQFCLDLSGEMLTVMADSRQLSQVLINLAINARDSMPDGGQIKIKTWLANLDEETAQKHGLEVPGDYAVISVSDNGNGMDERTLDRIFEPFFTTKGVGKGTGLGLSVVYGIIKQHKGSILVDSKPGEGTVFRICLPMVKAQIRRVKHQEKVLPTECSGTILVAEDEEFVRYFLKTTLSRAGYRLIVAEDGEEALRKFKKHQDTISLVISDMVMPKMNGRALYEEICKINPRIKMIFISGYAADMINCNEMPTDQVRIVTKPFSMKALFEEIKSILGSNC
jgi:two-component system cell cycle sensor histidine kinase/response regulator CckA